jgi:hypothetical protein
VTKGRRDAVERVELTEQQPREPALLPLAQELLDEPDFRVLLLAGAAFFLSFGHGLLMQHAANTGRRDLTRIRLFWL